MADTYVQAIDHELATLRALAQAPREPRLGCSTIAHQRLDYCDGCVDVPGVEVNGWRLLALRDKETRRD